MNPTHLASPRVGSKTKYDFSISGDRFRKVGEDVIPKESRRAIFKRSKKMVTSQQLILKTIFGMSCSSQIMIFRWFPGQNKNEYQKEWCV